MTSNFLLYSIFVPLILGLWLIVSGERSKLLNNIIAIVGFAVPAFISIVTFCLFANADKDLAGYTFYSNWNTGLEPFGIGLKLGLNGIATPLYLLAGIVGLAAGIYAMQTKTERKNLYLGLLLVMLSGLMGTFSSIDIFFFYFFHELALIPTFIMIGIWGGRNRFSISMELTIYLTLGAMLSLVGLIAIYISSDLNSFDLISLRNYLASSAISEVLQRNIFGLLLFGFGILVSLWPFHTWAPRGYGAAPTSAAMLHAGVLKKFGLYGLIQIALPLIPLGTASWVNFLAWLALGNVVIIGFVTMAQRDLKQMIGYSSVMHMGYCFLGIASMSTLGIGGAIVLMVAHGLSVSLLFLLSTEIHHRTLSLDMFEMGGLCQRAPVLCAFFVAATFASIGLPGFGNFWGELSVFVALWQMNPWFVVAAIAGVVISAIYGLRAVARIFFGEPSHALSGNSQGHPIVDLSWSKRIAPIILIGALLVIGFWPKFVLNNLNQSFIQGSAKVISKK